MSSWNAPNDAVRGNSGAPPSNPRVKIQKGHSDARPRPMPDLGGQQFRLWVMRFDRRSRNRRRDPSDAIRSTTAGSIGLEPAGAVDSRGRQRGDWQPLAGVAREAVLRQSALTVAIVQAADLDGSKRPRRYLPSYRRPVSLAHRGRGNRRGRSSGTGPTEGAARRRTKWPAACWS